MTWTADSTVVTADVTTYTADGSSPAAGSATAFEQKLGFSMMRLGGVIFTLMAMMAFNAGRFTMTVNGADEFHEDGTRLFNPRKPHGTVFGANTQDARWIQDGIEYRADRLPVGHKVAEKPPVITVKRPA